MRGELKICLNCGCEQYGSSPCAWGTRGGAVRADSGGRFIPMCGELNTFAGTSLVPIGSSPCAWGTRRTPDGGDAHSRFIPMCVGNSPSMATAPTSATVHPHVRGELSKVLGEQVFRPGSSPCAWGTLNVIHCHFRHIRFIPMCVGNSSPSSGERWARTVHPHVRGELYPRNGSS